MTAPWLVQQASSLGLGLYYKLYLLCILMLAVWRKESSMIEPGGHRDGKSVATLIPECWLDLMMEALCLDLPRFSHSIWGEEKQGPKNIAYK
jgi:hypothetical protein